MSNCAEEHQEHLLIDGYNLIKADPVLRQHEESSLLAARRALERSLRRYVRRTGVSVSVFYDGTRDIQPAQDASSERVYIRFARAPETADDLIKRFVQGRHGARYLRVITSDREIRRFARQHKIASTTAPQFAQELEEAPRRSQSTVPAPPPELDPELTLAPEEVDAWEQLFRNRRHGAGGGV